MTNLMHETEIHRRRLWRLINNEGPEGPIVFGDQDTLWEFVGEWLAEAGLLPEEESLLKPPADTPEEMTITLTLAVVSGAVDLDELPYGTFFEEFQGDGERFLWTPFGALGQDGCPVTTIRSVCPVSGGFEKPTTPSEEEE